MVPLKRRLFMRHPSPLKQPIVCAHRFKLRDQLLHSQSPGISREEFPSCSSGIAQLMAGPIILTGSPDSRSLFVYSLSRWQRILPKLWRLPKDNPLAKQFMVIFLGFSTHVQESAPFVLTTQLMDYARLGDEAIMLDFGEHHAEIWSDISLWNHHKQA